jgi:hypothetical protein
VPPAAAVPRDAFFARWRAIPAAPARASVRVERAAPLSSPAVDAALAAFGLGVQPGLDPDAANAVAAGSFAFVPPASPAGANAPPSLVPVMVRVEVDATSARRRLQVTVAADAPPLAGGLADLLAAVLRAA